MKSHFFPRSREGQILFACILIAYFLLQWPILPLFDQLILQPSGIPFLVVWVSGVYALLMAVLLYMASRGL